MTNRTFTTTRTFRRTLALAAVAALTLAACGDDDSGGEALSIADPWSRRPAEGQTVSAAYGVVSNPNDTDVTAVAASTDVTDTVELHETLMNEDGTMGMQEKEGGFVIPANGSFVFEPGGPHIMLLDIDPATYPDEIEITLEFDDADALTFTAEVRDVAGMEMGDGSMDDMDDMDDMDHGEMEMDDGSMEEMDDGES